ncbi:hypothetical protein [Coxiella burnetii]|uniref:Hypothetical cytosolic protein n=1 Tax=Coxiella burnetii (strain RSA 493 / Nine Mile phase I) TaxID=227377 RepID=Q83C05_COXBU|nr:hypothetical protein [Coxiella burnetii]NP_820321.1 hypothetical protein CBU_1332 [Coxiella burnetii RSA 493]AAO90835.1 hypothetical cytosolic protein [Coxiella burnetii RSA 493]MCF2093821.1 hypothetical protein [Coxiella burnetii]MCF2095599.1 hypothetical protein [Coxiella burnetii]MCF2097238.1 hypothetical protein [Coxiella burnetii]MCF2099087.1 hypothetical protein [Coxiella burnetii]
MDSLVDKDTRRYEPRGVFLNFIALAIESKLNTPYCSSLVYPSSSRENGLR